VLREENGLLHVLVTADDDNVSGSAMPYILPEFILFARSSCLWSGLPLPSGKATVGDLISVVYSDAAGKQGFVRAITKDSEFIVDETSRIPDQPLKIYDSQQIDGGVQVSI